ncbi:MAG TPA: VWA domain-containing protein [Gemmatimonadota bacterium]|nr:VWA domain-containing protein [Gemmatimonadota bacterium]
MKKKKTTTILVGLALLAGASPSAAQIVNPYGSSGEGEFYGLDVTGMSGVVYVLDLSGSMAGQTGTTLEREGAGRLERGLGRMIGGRAGNIVQDKLAERRKRVEEAKREVAGAIEGMAPQATFNILYFENVPHLWQSEMVTATEEMKEEAEDFLDDLAEGGGTGMMQAMQKAFEQSPQIVILVSDGEPTDASPKDILDKVEELNANGAVVIHTVVVGDDLDTTFMKQLAEQNGGETILRGKGLI